MFVFEIVFEIVLKIVLVFARVFVSVSGSRVAYALMVDAFVIEQKVFQRKI